MACSVQSVQSLSGVQLLETPWTAAHQVSLSSPSPGVCPKTDAETETPVLWTPDVKSRLIRKGPDAGED